MEPEEAEEYIAEATRHNRIGRMTLIGGEALLDVERTIAIGETALRCVTRCGRIFARSSRRRCLLGIAIRGKMEIPYTLTA